MDLGVRPGGAGAICTIADRPRGGGVPGRDHDERDGRGDYGRSLSHRRDDTESDLSERGERLHRPPDGHWRRRGGDGGGHHPLRRAGGESDRHRPLGQPPHPRGSGPGGGGGAAHAHHRGGDPRLPVLRGGQGRGPRHGGADRGPLRDQRPAGDGGGAGAAEQDPGHHRPEGHGDRRELPLPDGDAAAAGLPLRQRPAPDSGRPALPPLRQRVPGAGPGQPLPPGGRALRRGLRRHGRDRPVHGGGRGQPPPGGGRRPLRADLQPEQRPRLPAPGQAPGRRQPAHRVPAGHGGDLPGRPHRPGGGPRSAGGEGGGMLPQPALRGGDLRGGEAGADALLPLRQRRERGPHPPARPPLSGPSWPCWSGWG